MSVHGQGSGTTPRALSSNEFGPPLPGGARRSLPPTSMRTLQFAPIAGRRGSVSRRTWWIAPSLAVHALFVVASGVSLVPRAKDDNRPAHEVIFLAPMLPKNEPSPVATSDGSGPKFSPGWATLDATAKSAGEAVGTTVGQSNGTTHTLAQAQRDLVEPETPETPAPGDEHVFQAVDVDREVAREADAVAPAY